MSVWRKRRMKTGLTVSEVANYLDIDYNRYMLIDRGIVKMPSKYIDKFNELIQKSKGEKNVNRLTREEIVNKWWDEMSTKVGHGEFKLNEKMRSFNIETLNELGLLLGYKNNSGMMSNYLNSNKHVSFDIKNKVYSFFENELNIQAPKVKRVSHTPRRQTIRETDAYCELLEWFNDFDLKLWKDERGITNRELHELSGLAVGTIYNIMNKIHDKPTIAVMQRLKEFVDNYSERPVNKPISQVMTFTCVPTEEVPEDIRKMGRELAKEANENMALKERLLTKYKQEVERLSGIIEEHKSLIADLKRAKDFYEQIINDINED